MAAGSTPGRVGVPELTAAARGSAGPGYVLDADLSLQQLIDVRIDRDLPRLWACCLCPARGAAGRAQAHSHYLTCHADAPGATA